jgi:hypothetical protein
VGQNGSQRWATGKNSSGVVVTLPKDWRCILDHYCNDNYNNTGAGTGLRTAQLNGGGRDDEVAFTNYDSRSGQFFMYSMNGDGSAQTQLTNSTGVMGFHATWAPGGGKLAFQPRSPLYSGNMPDSLHEYNS